MTQTNTRPRDPDREPLGVVEEGMDPYPTYRDGPGTPHVATGTKPTDVDLPIARRTHPAPILIGLGVFALVIVGYIAWASMHTAGSNAPELTAGEPVVSAPATTGTIPESPGAFDTDVGIDTSSGPADIGAAPGAVDVPGGAATAPEPAQ